MVFGWGIQAQAATMLTFGLYLVAVTVMQLISPGGKRRGPAPLVSLGAFGLMLCVLGIWGMQIGLSA